MKSRVSTSKHDSSSELDIPLRLLKQQREKQPPNPLHSRTQSLPMMMLLQQQSRSVSPQQHQLPVVGEDCVITPTTSPKTPPKKLWERQYGSFLRKNNQGHAPPNAPPLFLSSSATILKRNRSSGSSASSSGTFHNSPLASSPTTCVELKKVEGSVRGGSLFQNVFGRNGGRRHGSRDELDAPCRRASHTSSHGSRDELDGTLRRGTEKGDATARKAFTDFHNSAGGTKAPYLGDDRSVHAGLHLLAGSTPSSSNNRNHPNHNAVLSRSLERLPHPRIPSAPDSLASTCILRPLVGVQAWQPGRRYLITPAILAACTPTTMAHLFRHKTVDLGTCGLRYASTAHDQTVRLVLYQNFLLEYEPHTTTMMPRGYCHLAMAQVSLHPDFPDTHLRLEYTCSSNATHVLSIRVDDPTRTPWIVEQIQHAIQHYTASSLESMYEWQQEEHVMQGEYATVRAGRRRHTTEWCALKIFDKQAFWKRVVKGQERADTMVREAAVQATLSCQTTHEDAPLVKLLGVVETTQHVILEMEWLPTCTDLFKCLTVSSTPGLPEPQAAQILWDVLTALDCMSRAGVAHRDVKPANILIVQQQRAKLCDFGMAAFCGPDGQVRGRCGTPGYVAPEIFKAGPYGGYGNQVDVFSLGATAYVCLCGYEPFYGETEAELKQANKRAVLEFPPDEWSRVSAAAKELVQLLMEPDPQQRPTLAQAMEHAWFQQHIPLEQREKARVMMTT